MDTYGITNFYEGKWKVTPIDYENYYTSAIREDICVTGNGQVFFINENYNVSFASLGSSKLTNPICSTSPIIISNRSNNNIKNNVIGKKSSTDAIKYVKIYDFRGILKSESSYENYLKESTSELLEGIYVIKYMSKDDKVVKSEKVSVVK